VGYYIKKIIFWIIFEFFCIRLLWHKLRPPIEEPKSKPSSFLFWFIASYVSFFGLASQRYENKVDVLESRLNFSIQQLALIPEDKETDGVKKSNNLSIIHSFVQIQTTKIPSPPELCFTEGSSFPACIYSGALSLFTSEVYAGVQQIVTNLIIAEKLNLRGANLQNINLEEADFTNAILIEANLEEAKLNKINLSEANLSNANLTNANLYKANLTNANLFKADLTGAQFEGADLTGANLDLSYLTGANFKNAYFYGATTRSAFKSANLELAVWKDGSLCNISNSTQLSKHFQAVQILH